MMNKIKMVSLMAGNADFLYRKLVSYLASRAGIEISVVDEIDWREREKMLDCGLAQLGFICGLQYVRKVDEESKPLELLVAPVMLSSRYQNRPIYFSDVVVRRDSPFKSLWDLRDRLWACNEPTSHSGCNLIRYHLAARGEDGSFFRQIFESGSHQNSLAMLVAGQIDATAIDSTVLELELSLRPQLRQHIRVIETLGPSPIPPSVISASVEPEIKRAIQRALLTMNTDSQGQATLAAMSIARFEQVGDGDYDEIRMMTRTARRAAFALTLPQVHRQPQARGDALPY